MIFKDFDIRFREAWNFKVGGGRLRFNISRIEINQPEVKKLILYIKKGFSIEAELPLTVYACVFQVIALDPEINVFTSKMIVQHAHVVSVCGFSTFIMY